MVNGLCQSFCFITWQHLLRGSFLSSTLLFNGQWSVSVFLFYNLTTPIKRKLPILHIVNGQWSAGQSFCFITWQHLLRGSFLSSTLLMVNGLCQSYCFITWQHLLRGSFLSSTLLMVNGLCQCFCFITWQHLLRGSFLSSILLFNGQWSVSVFLFYNLTTPIKRKLPILHIVNGQWSVSVFLFYNLTTPIKRKFPILHIVI